MASAPRWGLAGALVSTCLGWALPQQVDAADLNCNAATLTSPPPGSTVADVRPLFEWVPLPGVERYRVRLVARVQEGEITTNIDTLVAGTAFRPSDPLTTFRADIRIAVTGDCPAPGSLDGIATRYRVDHGLACAIGKPAWDASTTRLTWAEGSSTTEYEVLVFGTPDARLLGRETVRSTVWQPRARLPAGTVLAVQPRCGAAHGDVRVVKTSAD